MIDSVNSAIFSRFGVYPKSVEPLGGGFYGRAFLAEIDKEPRFVVVKLYLFDGLVNDEAEQLEILSRVCALKVPKVYGVCISEKGGLACDALLMEYIKGRNAGWADVSKFSEEDKVFICESIVDNLIGIHNTINEDGFGKLSSNKRYQTWQEYYYPVAKSIVDKAEKLLEMGQIDDYVMSVFERSLGKFGEIFYLPITEARLIHGDYNTWNIMLCADEDKAHAVIDPFNCMFGDSEYDLYQLDNANGKDYGLLDLYKSKVKLSESFEAKRSFYQLYSEVCHYFDAKVEVDLLAVEVFARNLEMYL